MTESTPPASLDFRGFVPSLALKELAQKTLTEMTKLITVDCTLISRVEYDGREFCCSFDLFQKRGSLYSIDIGTEPSEVIQNAAEKLKRELLQTHFTPVNAESPSITLAAHH